MTTKQSKSEHTAAGKLNPTGDLFVDDCFSFDISQQKESRIPSEIKELKEVPGLVQKKEYSKAWNILDRHQDEYSDLDFIYVWQATILQRNGQEKEARETLNDGLKLAKIRHVLCDRMGLLEYEAGQMEKAVKWWIRSIALMLKSGTLKMWEPFLYLAYVAKACGSQNLFNRLMGHVSQISPQGDLSLEPDAEKQTSDKAATLPKKSVILAIDHLYDTFGKAFKVTESSQLKEQTNTNQNPKTEADISQGKPNKNKISLLLGLGSILIVVLLTFFLFSSPTDNSLSHNRTQQEEDKIETNQAIKPESEKEIPQQQASPQQAPSKQKTLTQNPSDKAPLKTTEPPTSKEPVQSVIAPPHSPTKPTPHKEKLRRLKVKTKTTHPDIKKKSD